MLLRLVSELELIFLTLSDQAYSVLLHLTQCNALKHEAPPCSCTICHVLAAEIILAPLCHLALAMLWTSI